MKRSDAPAKVPGTGLPACILSLDLHILARNESALALSKKFRIGSNFTSCLEPTDRQDLFALYKQGEVGVFALSLPEQEEVSALFIPTVREDQPCFWAVCFKGQMLADLPSRLSKAFRPSTKGDRQTDAESEFAAEFFTKTFRRSYALGLSAEERKDIFLIRHACAFLNRFSDRSLVQNGMEIEAFCTEDSEKLPLYNFPRFTALLVGICLFCVLSSRESKVKVLFYTERERACARLSFLPSKDYDDTATGLPDLFETPLQLLSFSAVADKRADGRMVIDILCQKTMPAGSIFTPEDELLIQNLLEIMLQNLLS